MNFNKFITTQYGDIFEPNVRYIDVKSIENEYIRSLDADLTLPNAMFSNWLELDRQSKYPAINTAYKFAGTDGVPLACLDNIDDRDEARILRKLSYLIRIAPMSGVREIHPILAIIFAIQISPEFALSVLRRISNYFLLYIDAVGKHDAKCYDIEKNEIVTRFHEIINRQNDESAERTSLLMETKRQLDKAIAENADLVRHIQDIEANNRMPRLRNYMRNIHPFSSFKRFCSGLKNGKVCLIFRYCAKSSGENGSTESLNEADV